MRLRSETSDLTEIEKTTPFENLHTREYRVHENEVRSVAWNITGTKIASGSEDKSVRFGTLNESICN